MATAKQKRRGGGRPFPKGQIPPGATPWPKGVSGNPEGRQPAGLFVKEEINRMAGWTEAQVKAVMKNKNATAAQRAAARCWLDAMSQQYTAGGTPVAGADLERILDHTVGKPGQSVKIQSDARLSVRAGARQVADDLSDPAIADLVQQIGERLAVQPGAAGQPADGGPVHPADPPAGAGPEAG